MKLKKIPKNLIELKDLDTPFQKDTKFDILGLVLAIIVGIGSFYFTPPHKLIEWILKIIEFSGIVFAGWAIGLMINKFKDTQIQEKQREILERRAKERHLSLDKYLSTILEDISKPIRKWADKNKISYDYLKYSSYRHTMDFHKFPVDYIDIQIVDYHLEFTIRMKDTEHIKKILRYLLNSEIKLVLTIDNYHLGNHPRERIEQRSIEKIKKTLIESILNPSYSIKTPLFV